MKFTKILGLVVCLAWLFTTSSSKSQELTDNIVYTTLNPPPPGAPFNWNGFINLNTGGGGLSGGNMPAYNSSTGTFVFGYTQQTVAYNTAINFALANAGTGIQVSGFKYSWQYFNQDYSRGTLTGNISVTNNLGATVQSYNYNMPQTTSGWTTMSGTQNFGTQYAPSNLGNLNVSFTGKDDRFWAGYYGPQIRNIDVRLQYTVAPPPLPTFSSWDKVADENGEFTLSKAAVIRYGANDTWDYKELQAGTYSCSNGAWGKDPLGGVYKRCELGVNSSPTPPPTPKIPTPTETVTTVNTFTTSEPLAAPTTTTVAPTSTSTPTEVTQTQPTQTTSTTSASAPVTITNSTSSSTPIPSATNPQPRVGEVTVSGSAAKTSGPSVSQILSIVRNEQTRIGNLETSTVQQAVEQAQAISDKTQKDSISISAATINQSQSASQAASMFATNPSQSNNASTTNLGLNSANKMQEFGLQPTKQLVIVSTQPTSTRQENIYTLSLPSYTEQATTFSTNQQTTYVETKFDVSKLQEDLPKTEGLKLTGVSPLMNTINATQIPQLQTNNSSRDSSVKTNVTPNELSRGVDISSIAVNPAGFNAYISLALKDGQLYKSEEIYRNQVTVDNVRALRQLSSDRLHQQMVNQQYRN